jgi:hypothetical protein
MLQALLLSIAKTSLLSSHSIFDLLRSHASLGCRDFCNLFPELVDMYEEQKAQTPTVPFLVPTLYSLSLSPSLSVSLSLSLSVSLSLSLSLSLSVSVSLSLSLSLSHISTVCTVSVNLSHSLSRLKLKQHHPHLIKLLLKRHGCHSGHSFSLSFHFFLLLCGSSSVKI